MMPHDEQKENMHAKTHDFVLVRTRSVVLEKIYAILSHTDPQNYCATP